MNASISNLQELANQWGKAYSQKHGTTCRWVELHAKQPAMNEPDTREKYARYKISSRVLNVRYEDDCQQVPLPSQMMTSSYNNNSPGVGAADFDKSKEITSSFSWSITEGIEMGLTEEITIGVPAVLESNTTLSTKLSLNSTQAQAKEITDKWEIKRTISVPPYTHIDMKWTIDESNFKADFNAEVEITGYFAIWNEDKVKNPSGQEHWLYFVPVAQAFREMKEWGVRIPANYHVHQNHVIFHAKGTCNIKTGVRDTFSAVDINGKVVPLVPIAASTVHQV